MAESDPTLDPEGALGEASWILEQVSNGLAREVNDNLRLRFPRGFLHTAQTHRQAFPFVKSGLLRKNLGYAFMLADVYWWILYRTDLASVPQDMVVKAALALQGGIVEALLNDALAGIMGKHASFRKRTEKLVELKIIAGALEGELNWLWEMRNQQHLYGLSISEFDFYKRGDLERAMAAVESLMAALRERGP
jgi:hypothetical protein